MHLRIAASAARWGPAPASAGADSHLGDCGRRTASEKPRPKFRRGSCCPHGRLSSGRPVASTALSRVQVRDYLEQPAAAQPPPAHALPRGSGAARPSGALRAIDSTAWPRSWRTCGPRRLRRQSQACPHCHAAWYGATKAMGSSQSEPGEPAGNRSHGPWISGAPCRPRRSGSPRTEAQRAGAATGPPRDRPRPFPSLTTSRCQRSAAASTAGTLRAYHGFWPAIPLRLGSLGGDERPKGGG
jgi:hypothetical protein